MHLQLKKPHSIWFLIEEKVKKFLNVLTATRILYEQNHCNSLLKSFNHSSSCFQVMWTSSHGAQLCRFWVIEKQILLAAGSTGYNSVADVVVGPSLGFPVVEIIVCFKPSNTWKEQAQQVPVEGWKGRFVGQELLPFFSTGIFSPCWVGLDFLELFLVPAAQLGVLLVVVGDLHLKHLKAKPVIAVAWWAALPQHPWEVLLLGTAQKCHPRMVLGITLSLPGPAGQGCCSVPQNKPCHLRILQSLELISNKWLFLPLSPWNPALCSFLEDAELSPVLWHSHGSNKVWDGMGSAHEEETLDLWSCFNPEPHSAGGNPWPAKAPAGLSLGEFLGLFLLNSSRVPSQGTDFKQGRKFPKEFRLQAWAPLLLPPPVPHPGIKSFPAFLILLGIPRCHSNIYSQLFSLPVCANVLPSQSG